MLTREEEEEEVVVVVVVNGVETQSKTWKSLFV
jgi:hypothetical protein